MLSRLQAKSNYPTLDFSSLATTSEHTEVLQVAINKPKPNMLKLFLPALSQNICLLFLFYSRIIIYYSILFFMLYCFIY